MAHPSKLLSLKLGHKFILSIVFVVVLSSIATSVLFIIYGEDIVRDSIWQDMELLLINKDEHLLPHITNRDYWSLFRVVQNLSENRMVNSSWIIDQDGYIMAHSDPLNHPLLSYSLEFDHADIAHKVTGISGTLATLYIDLNESAITSTLSPLRTLVYIGNLVVLTLSLLIAGVFSRHINNRFKLIFHELSKASHGRPGDITTIKFAENDEIQQLSDELTQTFHGLADSLENTRFAQEFYNSVLNSVPDILLVVEYDGTIIYANTQHQQLDLQLHEVLGLKWQILFKHLPHLQPHKDDAKTWLTGEGIVSLKNGRFHALITLSQLASFNIVTIRNIDTIKSLEQQVSNANTYSALGRLSANFAHEIKNVIAPIRLLYRINHHTPQDIAIMGESIKQIDALVTKYLNFSRADPLSTDHHAHLDRITSRLIEMYSSQIQDKQLVIDVNLAPVRVMYNEAVLRGIVGNLLLNAIEASPQNARIWINLFEEGRYIVFTITDMGAGITDEDKERIFEPFFTTKPNGSGIGLATVNHYVQAMSGHILLENPAQGGISFTVMLPIPE